MFSYFLPAVLLLTSWIPQSSTFPVPDHVELEPCPKCIAWEAGLRFKLDDFLSMHCGALNTQTTCLAEKSYFYTINIWETKRNAWNLQEGLTEFLSRFLYSFYIILIFVSFCGRFVSCWRTNRAACLKGSSVSAWDDNPLSTCSGAVNLTNVSIDVWHCSIHAWKN